MVMLLIIFFFKRGGCLDSGEADMFLKLVV